MMAVSISVRQYLVVLICVSLMVSDDEPLFMLLSPCLLQKNIYWVFCPFFSWGVWFFVVVELMSCLYVLEIKSFLVASFANIFSQSIGCIFVLFMASFVVQKLVVWFALFIYAFISITLGDWHKKTLVWFMSENVLPMFSSGSFVVSCLLKQ